MNTLSVKALQKNILDTFFYPVNCYVRFYALPRLDEDWTR